MSISVVCDEERLAAISLYMEQKNTDLKSELSKTLNMFFAKYVPANVREFIEMKSELSKPRRAKPVAEEEGDRE